MKQLLFLLALSVPSLALAEKPLIILTGPTGCQTGDIALLDASESVGDFFKWQLVSGGEGDGPLLVPFDSGKKCIVQTRPGVYKIALAVSTAEGIELKVHTLTVRRDQGPDPVDPVDPVDPDPTFPDGKYKLAKFMYDSVQGMNDKAGVGILQGILEGAVSKNAGARFESAQKFYDFTIQQYREQLANRGSWRNWGNTKWLPEIRRLAEQGGLSSLDDHVTAWEEMIAGLEEAK